MASRYARSEGNFTLDCLPFADYLAIDRKSSSLLKKMGSRSPAHALTPTLATPAMQWGTSVHFALEHLDSWEDHFSVLPEFKGTGSKARKSEFIEQHTGQTFVSQQEMMGLKTIAKRVEDSQVLQALLEDAALEESGFFTDPVYGVDCKIRPDVLNYHDRIILDWKTCQDATRFPYDAKKYLYHLQAAFYLDGMSEITGEDWETFLFVAIESKPPYGLIIYQLDSQSIARGRKLYCDALAIASECEVDDKWPCYSDQIRDLTIWE